MKPDAGIRCPECGETFPPTEDMWERAESHQLRRHPETVAFANVPEIPPSHPRIAPFTDTIGRGLRP